MNADQWCDELERVYDDGSYPLLSLTRPWSQHNPTISGELARPVALRSYLRREITRLLDMNASIQVDASRPRLALSDPEMFQRTDESAWDLKQKKLFLFPAERMELSLDRLARYTGTPAEDFQASYLIHIQTTS